MSRTIIIIGGGISGLMAARILSSSCKVILIECRNELGGRIRTHYSNNNIIEGGAEFVHGDLPLTMELIKEAGLHLTKAEGRMFRKEGKELKEQNEMVEGWDELFEKMKKEEVDMSLDNFLDKHFPGPRFDELKKEARQYAMGFDVADPADVSTLSLYNEWSNEETNYRIKEGYGALVDFLAKECMHNGCEIILNETVKQIDWRKGEVDLVTASGKKYTADKLLTTVPVSVFRDVSGPCSIKFTPTISEYINASKQIGFGSVIKVVVEFNAPLWKTGTAFIFSDELIPTWWTQVPLTAPTLTGWAGGPMADKIADNTDSQLLEIAVNSLSRIFEISVAEVNRHIINVYVYNWKGYAESGGAYSYATTQSRIARKTLNTPLDSTIFFAGEALYDGQYSGTVEAALNSGKSAANEILSSAFE